MHIVVVVLCLLLSSYVYLLYYVCIAVSCLVCIVVSCLVCIVVILCVFAVLCVYCCFYFRRQTAG